MKLQKATKEGLHEDLNLASICNSILAPTILKVKALSISLLGQKDVINKFKYTNLEAHHQKRLMWSRKYFEDIRKMKWH